MEAEMLTRLITERMAFGSGFVRLVVGSSVVALLVSLGTVGGLKLFWVEVTPALPAALAAVAAACYAATTVKR
jgi:hypothetical protein